MSTAFVTAAILFGSSPLQFTLKAPTSPVVAGRDVRCELVVKNISNKPVVVAKAIWDGAPAASLSATLTRQGQDVRFFGDSSMPSVQVGVGNRVDKDRFITLPPGGSEVVYWTVIEGEYVFPAGSTARDKAAYGEAKQRKLPPGTYELKVVYEFDQPRIADSWRKSFGRTIEFGPGAKALWQAAVSTRFQAACKFVVQ